MDYVGNNRFLRSVRQPKVVAPGCCSRVLGLTVGKVLRIGVSSTLGVRHVHVQKLCEEPNGRLGADVKRLHEGDREGGQELHGC